ncbi:programmed cell death protein 1 [Ochotona princeps]|uniref:programmed cell death protein 1 n=1 Tax=Ochotona princeps TaxID=9978 RepID=UPI0027150512|nr:programmed cell death protein 1 [Ochotona princeps]
MRVPRVPWSLLWALLQLSWRPGWLLDPQDRPWSLLTFFPAQSTVPEGANATFTCSFSNTSKHFVLNLYRLSPSNQRHKLAAFPEDRSQPPQDGRFSIIRLPDGSGYLMSVVGVRLNDSGIYLCGAISLHPRTQIKESSHAELRVTERPLELSTAQPSPSPRPPAQLQGLVIGVPSILVGVLLLLLLAWVLVATCSKTAQEAEGATSLDQTPKDKPLALPSPTMDYGELDFQWREKTPEPPAACIPEPTEYATIVFPDGLGASVPGRRGSADHPRDPRPLRPEDGHCSWPL